MFKRNVSNVKLTTRKYRITSTFCKKIQIQLRLRLTSKYEKVFLLHATSKLRLLKFYLKVAVLFYFTIGWSTKYHEHLFPFSTVSFHDCCFFKMDSLKSSSNKRLTKNPVFMFSSSSSSFGAGFGLSDTSSHFSTKDLKISKTVYSLKH